MCNFIIHLSFTPVCRLKTSRVKLNKNNNKKKIMCILENKRLILTNSHMAVTRKQSHDASSCIVVTDQPSLRSVN